MAYFTSNTYQMKREILTFSNKFSRKLPKPERKFIAEMNYGILASKSCLLTDIVDQLHETSKKINIVDRLSHHLAKGTPGEALKAYLTQVKKWCPAQPVIHIDDSDVVKPDGYKFESLGWVRDGSESTATKNVYKKGYHVTEATVLTNNNHPLSLFSEIHSSSEKNFMPQTSGKRRAFYAHFRKRAHPENQKRIQYNVGNAAAHQGDHCGFHVPHCLENLLKGNPKQVGYGK